MGALSSLEGLVVEDNEHVRKCLSLFLEINAANCRTSKKSGN